MLVKELLDKKVEYDVVKATNSSFTTRAKIGNRTINFYAYPEQEDDLNVWHIEFDEETADKKTTYKATGSGNELEVFSMVRDSILELISRYHPPAIVFTADKDNGGSKRADTYEKLLKKFKAPGYSYKRVSDKEVGYESFELVKN